MGAHVLLQRMEKGAELGGQFFVRLRCLVAVPVSSPATWKGTKEEVSRAVREMPSFTHNMNKIPVYICSPDKLEGQFVTWKRYLARYTMLGTRVVIARLWK